MRQQHKGRQRSRGRRQPNPANRVYESNGPGVKVRGTAQHVADKYMQLGRDALSSGDAVKAEGFFQYAEHYLRIIAAAQEQMAARRQQQIEQREQRNRGNGRDRDQDRQDKAAAETNGGKPEEQPQVEKETADKTETASPVQEEQPTVEADPSWGGPQPGFLAAPAGSGGEKAAESAEEGEGEEKPRRTRRTRVARRPRKAAEEE